MTDERLESLRLNVQHLEAYHAGHCLRHNCDIISRAQETLNNLERDLGDIDGRVYAERLAAFEDGASSVLEQMDGLKMTLAEISSLAQQALGIPPEVLTEIRAEDDDDNLLT